DVLALQEVLSLRTVVPDAQRQVVPQQRVVGNQNVRRAGQEVLQVDGAVPAVDDAVAHDLGSMDLPVQCYSLPASDQEVIPDHPRVVSTCAHVEHDPIYTTPHGTVLHHDGGGPARRLQFVQVDTVAVLVGCHLQLIENHAGARSGDFDQS